ncbi:hypothetical protein Lesp01_22820 [Lentzea sp. NBRC 102530]|nr:hypothetical protein Lesp01_22820 [Lentzea sp. NBRC 102530]
MDQVFPLMAKVGARNVLDAAAPQVLEGDWSWRRLVIHESESMQAVEDFWNSPEYAPLKELRRRYSTVRVAVGGA